MRLNTIKKKVKPLEELANVSSGKVVPVTEAMSTIRGSKIHLIDPRTASEVPIALCGAGGSTFQFPLGSSILAEDAIPAVDRDKFIVVDCYKCIKLAYINQLRAGGIQDAPERNFTPSDQQPDEPGSQKQRLGEILSPDAYERRRQHIMVPMGRYGRFGGQSEGVRESRGGGVTRERDADDYLEEVMGRVPEEGEVDWVRDYFTQIEQQGRWQVGEPERRTQQFEADPTQSYRLVAMNLLQLPGWDTLDSKTQAKVQALEDQLELFEEYLAALPPRQRQRVGAKLRSTTARKIFRAVSPAVPTALQTNPQRVLSMVEHITGLDKLMSEMESYAQSRR